MKKSVFLLSVIAGFFLFSHSLYAFEHGYQSDSDQIYALARNELPVYYEDDGDTLKTILPEFTGLTVIGSSGSWYEITYTSKKSGKQYGWVTKEEFTYDCLVYDGQEKQILADGTYQITYHRGESPKTEPLSITGASSYPAASYSCAVSYLGKESFSIRRKDTGEYLQPDNLFTTAQRSDLWGSEETAGAFTLSRQGSFYGIQDLTTNRYLGENEAGLLSFNNWIDTSWRFLRNGKATSQKSLHLFVQFDPLWATQYYGSGTNPDSSTNNFCTSACGIFATMNAIYSLTGQYADPFKLANYAVDKHYRIEGNGTDSAYFKAAAEKFGYQYGFRYAGSGESILDLKKRISNGETAIVYLPGHYGAIVDYSKKKNKFLLMDPHYLPKRATSSFGDWVSQQDLEEGALLSQMFFYYKQITK